ncbi:hypothetical protein OH76DRAFT_1118905 [Lentinus brumalis]|uniref:HNH nuclease domain-containing protein n=1 Tax=Lentinus brumalis TaxID=2498619 RepID=A0A371CUY9_9APHY|nr:hypothetical protein OH76DRAFT_1118905 [Polyporus brumalis]
MSGFTIIDGKISYSRPQYRHAPRNPAYRNMAVMDDEDDASETDSCDRKENELRDKLLSLDMLSFVTGTTRSLQLVYICPPIPNDIRQAEVEHLFSLVGFGKDFKLNSIQNSILLEADLHIAWDAYAAFAILPPRDYLTSLANALIACNAAWIAAYDKGSVERVGSADPSLALAVVRRPSHWRLIVLRPALLFSLHQPLMLLSQDARKVVASGGIPTASDWQSWYPHPQNPFLVPCASMDTNCELELPDIRDENLKSMLRRSSA